MESNIKNKIKVFERTKTQCPASLDINPTTSTQAKETAKLVTRPTAKPRRKKKKPTQTEPTEYANFPPLGEGAEGSEYANLSEYPVFDPSQLASGGQVSLDFTESGSEYANLSDNYWEFESTTQTDYSNLGPYDLEKSEYANLLPLGTTIEPQGSLERIYADPEGALLSIPERPNPLASEIPIEGAQPRLEQSEYANFPLSETDPEQFYKSFESARSTAKKKKTKKQSKPSEQVSDPDKLQYAEHDLAQSHYVNVPHRSQLDTTEEDAEDTQYYYQSHDNTLISSSPLDQDKVLNTARNEQEKVEPLEVQGEAVSGARNKIQRRKKNIRKENCPGSLPIKFEKLNIQPIQEEVAEDRFRVFSSSEMQQKEKKPSLFNFFLKKSTKEMKKPTASSKAMQNK